MTIGWNEDTKFILGQPNFALGIYEPLLRWLGYDIGAKAEEEQAASLHWMLTLYEEHGSNWRIEAGLVIQKYLESKNE